MSTFGGGLWLCGMVFPPYGRVSSVKWRPDVWSPFTTDWTAWKPQPCVPGPFLCAQVTMKALGGSFPLTVTVGFYDAIMTQACVNEEYYTFYSAGRCVLLNGEFFWYQTV